MHLFKEAFKKNYDLYLIEAWGLGTFMVSACLFTVLFEYPSFKMTDLFPSDFIRRLFIGCAMGLTAISIIYSPWGRKSGAQLNPSVTFTMLFLKKITYADAVFYTLFQVAGGTLAVGLLAVLIPVYLKHPSVNFVVTVPGTHGTAMALMCECLISFVLMFTTLVTSNLPSVKKYTGFASGILIMCFVTLEAPLSGMSMNPARTIASAIPSCIWTASWIYFTGPPLSMLFAAWCYNFLFFNGRLHQMSHYLAPHKMQQ